MSNSSEQEDFEIVLPPPIDWDDDGWDDDVLPPPPSTVSDDQMSVVSEDLPAPSESEAKSKPAEILDDGVPVPPPVHPSLVPDAGETVPICEHAAVEEEDLLGLFESKPSPTEIQNENVRISPPMYPSLVPEEEEITQMCEHAVAEDEEDLLGLSESKPSPTEIMDEDVRFPPPVYYPSLVPDVEEPAPRYKSDKTATEAVQHPSEAKSQPTEILPNTATQNQNLHSSQEFFYPPQHTPPRPSTPSEPTEIDESASTLAAILSALDPSERAIFLEEQNKILETIEREASNQKASSEAAWSMMVMENDAALAKRLQEEERRSNNNAVSIRGSNDTKKAMKDGKTILVECGSCHKNMHIPKGTQRMYCPICKAVCTFENRSSKRNSRGLFRLPGKSSNKAKTKR